MWLASVRSPGNSPFTGLQMLWSDCLYEGGRGLFTVSHFLFFLLPPPISWFCSEAQESHSSFFFQHKEHSHLPLTPKSLPTRKGHAFSSQKGSQQGRQSSPAPASSSGTKGHILSWVQWVPAPKGGRPELSSSRNAKSENGYQQKRRAICTGWTCDVKQRGICMLRQQTAPQVPGAKEPRHKGPHISAHMP